MIHRSYCRVCTSVCGTLVDVQGDKVVSIRGDVDHPLTRGYTCPKGRDAATLHDREDRLLHPQMRGADGQFGRTSWNVALDDIATRLNAIIAEHGPDAVGVFMGGGGYIDASCFGFSRDILAALGTRSYYSDMTIDAAAPVYVSEVMSGMAGAMTRPDFGRCKLVLYVGTNPMVSHGHGAVLTSPTVRLRELTADGEAWVLDPRRTETAARATRHLIPRPGTDYAVLAFLVREILRDGADRTYLDAHAQDIDRLRAAVEPFACAHAATISGIAPDDLVDLLAAIRRAGRLCVDTGTGVSMSRSGNVTQWLSWALMIVTGSMDREGGVWVNPGFLTRMDQMDIPLAPEDGWRLPGPASRPELKALIGEFPCVALADEIEAGNLRALINLSGNLVSSLPDTDRSVAALGKLDLLVSIETRHSATVQISTHALPSKNQFERPDISLIPDCCLPEVAASYTPAVIAPLSEDIRSYWWILAELGRRMGRDFCPGIDPDSATDEDVLRLLAARGRPGLEPTGEARYVVSEARSIGWLQARVDTIGGWRLAPRLLVEQLEQLDMPSSLVLITRRHANAMNSIHAGKKGRPGIFLSPEDAQAYGLADGEQATVRSPAGALTGEVRIDATMPRGALAVPHGWVGSQNVNQLTSNSRDFDPLTGMPLYSGIAVELIRVAAEQPEPALVA
jgi:anaerobic selenocysteine-containing dehydrogenase